MRYPIPRSAFVLCIAGVLGACAYSDVTRDSPARASAAAVDTAALVGTGARNLSGAMAARGFSRVGGYQAAGASITTWWNADTRQCLTVAVRDGRVVEIGPVDRGNCH